MVVAPFRRPTRPPPPAPLPRQARSLPTGSLRPAFLAGNGAVYGVQAGLWAWAAAAGREKAGGAPRAASLGFMALASAAAAVGFVLYGGRLFFMLRR